jgi:hypothetical protein
MSVEETSAMLSRNSSETRRTAPEAYGVRGRALPR